MTDDPIPRNISMMLRFLRESSAHSLRRMADELNKTSGRKIPGKRGQPAKFDHDLIDSIENRERLKIWHLGRYANWYGMPVGAILLFSQLASHMRDGDVDDIDLTKSVAEAVKTVCDYVIKNADRLAAGLPDNGAANSPRDRMLEALLRECAYKNADPEQRQQDARLISAIYQIMNQYALEAKKRYRDHSDKKFNPHPESSEA